MLKYKLLNGKTWFQDHIAEQAIEWWLNHGNQFKRTKTCHSLCEILSEHMQMACTKMLTAELMDISRLWGLLNMNKVGKL